MSTLLLRLAAPMQSFAGFRLLANRTAGGVPTAAIPRKSAINGLLGASQGRRDLETLGTEYDMFVRVDRTNPVESDLQLLTSLPAHMQASADRAEKIRTASSRASVPERRTGGSLVNALTEREFIPHAEFILAIKTRDPESWLEALHSPVFMTYIGNRDVPTTFPFILGISPDEPEHLLAQFPHVPRPADTSMEPLRVYHVTGDYNHHIADVLAPVTPTRTTRTEQLTWATQHLSR